MYEQWIAFEEPAQFVHEDDHNIFANRAGWWCTAWKGELAQVLALGYEPVPRIVKQ